MIVKRADFITSMKDYGAFATKGCPEVAFAGKSNVGKSSMINRLTNRNKLARTSATPGKTRLINVYQINDEINFIDLPGYGFAKVSKEEKLSWGKMMQDYFATTLSSSFLVVLWLSLLLWLWLCSLLLLSDFELVSVSVIEDTLSAMFSLPFQRV